MIHVFVHLKIFFFLNVTKVKQINNPNPQFKLRIRIVVFVQKWGRIRIATPRSNTGIYTPLDWP